MTHLAPFGITPNAVQKIHEFFGAESEAVIRERPFELCGIPGFGFIKADDIARRTGCPPNDPLRIRGALFYALSESRKSNGHLFLTKDDLCRAAVSLLNGKLPENAAPVMPREVSDGLYDIVKKDELIADDGAIYLPRDFEAEENTARRIAGILAAAENGADIDAALAEVKEKLAVTPSEKQEDAIRMAFRHSLSVITGSPGTGKTTVLKLVIAIFGMADKNGKILLAAPTGKASRRMAESTGFSEAKTLHSALGLITSNENEAYLNSREPVDADFLIIDEFSMVDMQLASELFSRVRPGTKVLLVGDADQLPSVGAGNVFREMIESGLVPVTVLDRIFRQSGDSLIAHNAKSINESKAKLLYGADFVFRECKDQKEAALEIMKIYPEEAAKSGIENVQILSPYRADGEASAEKLNEAVRELVNPAAPGKPEIKAGAKLFRVNDRVMQTKNKNGISNGDVGFVKEIRNSGDGDASVTIEFTGGREVKFGPAALGMIELSYAMTVHKAMGSEYDTVILPILSAHSVLLHRNLIYTAVTRAKKKAFLVGQKSSLFVGVHKNKNSKRNSLLARRIARYCQTLGKTA
jgi:exodeoxyribonuclease V alpha subunit